MKDYLELGHIELIRKSDYTKMEAYYLTYHAFLNESNNITKLHFAFEASCISLKDLLIKGDAYRNIYIQF